MHKKILKIVRQYDFMTEFDFEQENPEISLLRKIITSNLHVNDKINIMKKIDEAEPDFFYLVNLASFHLNNKLESHPIFMAEKYDNEELVLSRFLISRIMKYKENFLFNYNHHLRAIMENANHHSSILLKCYIENGLNVNNFADEHENLFSLINKNHKNTGNMYSYREQNENITNIINVLQNFGFDFKAQAEKIDPLSVFVINKVPIEHLNTLYSSGYPELNDEAKRYIFEESYIENRNSIDKLIELGLHKFLYEDTNPYFVIVKSMLSSKSDYASYKKDIEKLSKEKVSIRGFVPSNKKEALYSHAGTSFINFIIESHPSIILKDTEHFAQLVKNSGNNENGEYNALKYHRLSSSFLTFKIVLPYDTYKNFIFDLNENGYNLSFETIISLKNDINKELLEEMELIEHNFHQHFFNYINKYETLTEPFIRHDFEVILNHMKSTTEQEIDYLHSAKLENITAYWQKHILDERINNSQNFPTKPKSRL